MLKIISQSWKLKIFQILNVKFKSWNLQYA